MILLNKFLINSFDGKKRRHNIFIFWNTNENVETSAKTSTKVKYTVSFWLIKIIGILNIFRFQLVVRRRLGRKIHGGVDQTDKFERLECPEHPGPKWLY